MVTTITDLSLLRLMQLSSPALPVGGYSFSQGMEYAIDAGWVATPDQVIDWLQAQLMYALGRVDVPVIFRLYQALASSDIDDILYWNDFLLASRETQELRLTDTAMGAALKKMLVSQGIALPCMSAMENDISFITLFSMAAHGWHVPAPQCALGFCWSWLENQVAAATKLVPLGQTQAQALILQMQPEIPHVIEQARQLPDDELGGGLPGLAIASCLHETQYSRLFRS